MKKLILKLKKFLKLFSLNDNLLKYIGGGEVLPSPFSPEKEAELLERLSNGDDEVKDKLIEHNLRLVVYIARRFENTGVDLDDLVSVGTIGLIKAVNSFNVSKNIKLATYASRCIENEILMYIRKSSSQRCEMSFDEPLNIDKDGNELLLSDIIGSDEESVFSGIEKDEEKKLVRDALSRLDPRECEIIELRYGIKDGHEYTQKQVAQMLGISQSYISRLEKRIIERLHNEMKDRI